MAYNVYTVAVARAGAGGGAPGSYRVTPALARCCETAEDAKRCLRELTWQTVRFQAEAQRRAPEVREEFLTEFLANERFFSHRRVFVGPPPLERLTAALNRQKGAS